MKFLRLKQIIVIAIFMFTFFFMRNYNNVCCVEFVFISENGEYNVDETNLNDRKHSAECHQLELINVDAIGALGLKFQS